MNKQYVVALSFANYLKDKTGIPKVMMAHQKMYNDAGISYVALFSVKKNILHDKVMLFCKFGLIVDGEYKGIFQMSQIIKILYAWQEQGCCLIDIHIHHLLYIKLKLVQELLDSCKGVPIKAYLHDYYFACKEYILLRNGKEFCGGLGLDSKSCSGCSSYANSVEIESKIHSLFKRYEDRILFVSPSETTKDIFLRYHPEYSNRIRVIPHQIFRDFYRENLEIISQQEEIKVAFLGMPRIHKGWNEWEKLVQNDFNQHYNFTVFNSSDDFYSKMNKVKIGFSKENLNAMTDALRENKIQIVLLWAKWPETYSYTCFEAFAANAFIITNESSGNIADVVHRHKNGIVLPSEDALYNLFKNKELLREMVNKYRLSTPGGPGTLHENDEIVSITLGDNNNGEVVYSPKPVNYPLLWLLNKIS